MSNSSALDRKVYGNFELKLDTDMRTNKVYWKARMIKSCLVSGELELPAFVDGIPVTNFDGAFKGIECPEIYHGSLDLSNVDMSEATSAYGMFSSLKYVRMVRLSRTKYRKINNMVNMFYECNDIESIDFNDCECEPSRIDQMFRGCSSLIHINFGKMKFRHVRDVSMLFGWCYALRELDLSSLDFSNVTLMDGMFNFCSSLEYVNFGNCKLLNNRISIYMIFYSCIKLKSVKLPNFDNTTSVMGYKAFDGCVHLENIITYCGTHSMKRSIKGGKNKHKYLLYGLSTLKVVDLRFLGNANLSIDSILTGGTGEIFINADTVFICYSGMKNDAGMIEIECKELDSDALDQVKQVQKRMKQVQKRMNMINSNAGGILVRLVN